MQVFSVIKYINLYLTYIHLQKISEIETLSELNFSLRFDFRYFYISFYYFFLCFFSNQFLHTFLYNSRYIFCKLF